MTSPTVEGGWGDKEGGEEGVLAPPEWTTVIVRDGAMMYTMSNLHHFQEYVIEARAEDFSMRLTSIFYLLSLKFISYNKIYYPVRDFQVLNI